MSYMGKLRALVEAATLEDPKAKQYWGDFMVDETKLELLFLSLYDIVRAFASPVPSVTDFKHAKPYANPQMMRLLLHKLDIKDLFTTEDDEKYLDHNTMFNLHRKYYAMQNLTVFEIDDPQTGIKMPLITRQDVFKILGVHMLLWPDEFQQSLNKLLADESLNLVNFLTNEPFEHKVIPRSCFPPKDHNILGPAEQREGIRAGFTEKWPKFKADTLTAARQRGPIQREQVSTQGHLNQAADSAVAIQLQAAQNTAMMAAASAGASAAAMSAWSTRNAAAYQSWGNF